MSPIIRKDRIWPAIVVGILLVDVGVGFAMMRLASDDPHAAIEADYYKKAITWDSTMVQAGRNVALGWTLTPALGAISDQHTAALALQLRDSVGGPIVGATVLVEAVQVGHAGEIVHLTIGGERDGSYQAELPMSRAGLWELRLIATRGGDRFTKVVRLDASTSRVATVVTARPGDARTP